MNQHRITPMTESGLLAALTVILAMIAVYLPVLGMFAALIWSLPIVVLVVRHGLRWGIMAVLISGIIMALLIEPLLSLRMVIAFAPMGLLLGLGFRKGWPGMKIFGVGLLASLLSLLAAFALVFAVTAVNPLNLQVDALQQSFDAVFNLYEEMGLDAKAIADGRQLVAEGMVMVQILIPLVVIMMGVIYTAIGYLAGVKVLRRLGHAVPQVLPFAQWRLPVFFLYLFGFAMVGIYWGGTRQIQPLYQLSMNANMLAIFAGLIQGLALTHCVLSHYRVSRLVRILLYVIVLTNGFLAQMVALTGLFDMLFDYRRRFSAQGKK